MKRYRVYLVVLMVLAITIFSNVKEVNCSKLLNNSAKGAILIERDSGRILYAKNAFVKMPEASTTKIMTALLALEYGNLDEVVKVDFKSIGVEGSSIYLRKDEKILLRDLVYGLMLRSGNDASIAIAIHISGSVEDFAKLMNNKAKQIGASSTNFTNPHGLHNDNHYTTAYDLAIITREALKHEEFRKIVSTVKWISGRNENKLFFNKNKTLWQYEGGDGVKIGFTKKAGRCLVSSATRNDMQLISVVLNDGNWFNDCYRMLDYGFNNYKNIIIYDQNQYVKSIYVKNGKSSSLPLVTANDLTIPLTENELKSVKTIIDVPDRIDAPVEKGSKIGSIKVYLNGKLLKKTDIIAKKNIKKKNSLEKSIDYIKKLFNS